MPGWPCLLPAPESPSHGISSAASGQPVWLVGDSFSLKVELILAQAGLSDKHSQTLGVEVARKEWAACLPRCVSLA